MNWYKKAKKEENEYATAPAIRIDGQIFLGNSHLEAILKAMKAKKVFRNKNGDFVDKSGKLLPFEDTGLFLTNKGRIITRTESVELGGGYYSEDIPQNQRKDFSNELV